MKLVLLLLAAGAARAQIDVIGPVDAATNETQIQMSLSAFGSAFSYTQETQLTLFLPPKENETGCAKLDARQGHFAFLLKQGECTFSKKAFVAQTAGAVAVVVYTDNPNIDVMTITPVSDSICCLTRPERQNPDRVHQQR